MDLFKAAKEAMAMRSKLSEMDEKLKAQVIDAECDGVKIKINAKSEFLSIEIPEELLKGKKQEIEKVVLKAVQNASEKAQNVMIEETKKLTQM